MPISHLLGESFYHSPDEANAAVDNVTILANGLQLNPSKTSSLVTTQEEKFVLIDTDAGTEDAWALFMTIAAHRSNIPLKVVGITSVYGTTSVDNVVNNVTRTLDTVHETSIPIFKGMNSSMLGKYLHSESFNGVDGFGDANLPQVLSRVQPEHAVDAIIKFAEAYPGKLTILCLGPLTNLAMAIKLRPDLRNMVKEIFILGGNMEGMGNITVSSEFNFFVDPEASFVVLENFSPCPITILPWETSAKFGALPHMWRINVLGKMRTEEINLLNKIETKILTTYQETWLVSDAILAACLINPKVIKKSDNFHCTVELSGELTRGMMVVDKTFMKQKPSNATLVLEIDEKVFESMLVWAAGGQIHAN